MVTLRRTDQGHNRGERMMEATVGAVLMVGHFVVSIFNVQLGNPVIYSLPFTTMEQCAKYQSYMPQEPVKIDLEWNHHTKNTMFYTRRISSNDGKDKPGNNQRKPANSKEINDEKNTKLYKSNHFLEELYLI